MKSTSNLEADMWATPTMERRTHSRERRTSRISTSPLPICTSRTTRTRQPRAPSWQRYERKWRRDVRRSLQRSSNWRRFRRRMQRDRRRRYRHGKHRTQRRIRHRRYNNLSLPLQCNKQHTRQSHHLPRHMQRCPRPPRRISQRKHTSRPWDVAEAGNTKVEAAGREEDAVAAAGARSIARHSGQHLRRPEEPRRQRKENTPEFETPQNTTTTGVCALVVGLMC